MHRNAAPGRIRALHAGLARFLAAGLTALVFLLALSVLEGWTADKIPFAPGDTLEQIREKIRLNGYNFTVSDAWISSLSPQQRANLHTRGKLPSRGTAAAMDASTLALDSPVALPASFDWRNVGGRAYLGPVRDQKDCGSCYAFAAAAMAEGAYNIANGRYNANCADFSEQYIAFCLGTYGPYVNSFDGCFGANYDYDELLALTQVGIIPEARMPYTWTDPGGCTYGDYAPRIKFASWGRVGCNDIDAIKAAIMTYGPVDAAVWVENNGPFANYSGGVFEDTLTSCTGNPTCAYQTTNHAITLVGWDDAGDAQNNGYWILRNSWGTNWGEQGYMRIKYTSARVGCSVAYLVMPPSGGRFSVPGISKQLLLQ